LTQQITGFHGPRFGNAPLATFVPATGVPAAIFTFYMAPDPATSPARPAMQCVFAASIALAYAILMSLHVVFALFFALAIVCSIRGICLLLQYLIDPGREPSVGSKSGPLIEA
jgi:hypothetical protein